MKINGQKEPVMRVQELSSRVDLSSMVEKKEKAQPVKAVEISSAAADLAGLQQEISKLPDVRMEKVDQLKQQISSGNYEIDDEKLATILSRFLP